MYVTHPSISDPREPGGRFGNQLFMIASTIGIAKFNDFKWAFKSWHNNKYFAKTLPVLPVLPDILHIPQVVNEKGFNYSPVILPQTSLVHLSGYFQSPKYFNNAEEEVRDTFQFGDQKVKVKQAYDNAKLGITCSISVRRTDYVKLQHIHPLQRDDYWVEAQRAIEEKMPIDSYIIFSDDTDWCKENIQLFKKTGKKVYIMKGTNSFDDFVMITLCNSHIIVNSSFSWWAAWLDQKKDKVVVMPKMWFGPQGPWSGPEDAEGKDLHVEGWIRI